MDIIQYNAMHKFVGVLDNPQSERGVEDSHIHEARTAVLVIPLRVNASKGGPYCNIKME